jgi:hypothetical protein
MIRGGRVSTEIEQKFFGEIGSARWEEGGGVPLELWTPLDGYGLTRAGI